MISAMGPQYQKYLWWKKHLTSLQLVTENLIFRIAFFAKHNSLIKIDCIFLFQLQFMLVFVHSAQVLIFDCGYPKLVAALLLVHSTIFFGLFFDFYQQAYRRRRKMEKLNGHVPKLNGHIPNSNGHLPEVNGNIPKLNGHLPKSNGFVKSNGHIPKPNGKIDWRRIKKWAFAPPPPVDDRTWGKSKHELVTRRRTKRI